MRRKAPVPLIRVGTIAPLLGQLNGQGGFRGRTEADPVMRMRGQFPIGQLRRLFGVLAASDESELSLKKRAPCSRARVIASSAVALALTNSPAPNGARASRVM